MLTAIAIDDEPDCLMAVKELVKAHSNRIKLLDSCTSIEEAYDQIILHKPDVLFLDVEIHDKTGFDLLEQLGDHDYKVIFTTAFTQYATKAFLVHALHYLTKPLQTDHFEDALSRVDSLSGNSERQASKLLKDAVQTFKEPQKEIEYVTISQRGETIIIYLVDLERCEADANYCFFYLTNGKKHMASKPLKHYAVVLEEVGFLRTHKSHLINPNFVTKRNKRKSSLTLKSGVEVPVSRSQKAKIFPRF